MLNPILRVATYARVSGEQQVKDDTIASQLEAIARRASPATAWNASPSWAS